jgi:hypothetical protein
MPNFRPFVSSASVDVPVLPVRFAVRFVIRVLLTSLDAGVIAMFGVTLYRVSADHPLWMVGLSLLFTVMFGSLLRVWTLTLRGRSR